MRLRLLPLPLVLMAVLMAGCAGDGDDEPSGSASEADLTGKGEAALRASVQAFSDAFLTGEGADAHALLTARCKEALPETEFSAVVAEAGDRYGTALEFTSYEAKIKGTKAKATYTYENPDLNQKDEPWVLEGDRWLQDDC